MTPLCPTCHQPVKPDGRTTQWRARIRLYDATRADDPIADTDAESPPDAAGEKIFDGLPAIAAELHVLATQFHGSHCYGLELETLQHSLKSLRPTIARRGGDAVWRLKYTTIDTALGVRAYAARVDVVRVGQ